MPSCIYVKIYVKRASWNDPQGSNGLQNTSCDVGMHFGNFCEYSVKIGNDKKMCMLSGKCRLHRTYSGRHTQLFIISDLYRLLTKIPEVHFTPVTLSLMSQPTLGYGMFLCFNRLLKPTGYFIRLKDCRNIIFGNVYSLVYSFYNVLPY